MNRLQYETSPYLKQHEHNPVDWFPWGQEALEKARKEDKPILVSIGYSACHWCHVMAHECFENGQLAAIMNEYFVNIKVDREERPDVDAIYMDALQAMGLRGGWPLNVFLMPDARPFYGGTYFPPSNWRNILLGIHQAFQTEREKLQESADSFAESLREKDSARLSLFDLQATNHSGWSGEELDLLISRLRAQFDPVKGGLERAPKFPMPSVWQFLTAYIQRYPDDELQGQLELTLNRIALGGIYDHVSGGWTRYSTDADWKVPHFEKMLYDNGQLLSLYSVAIGFLTGRAGETRNLEIYHWATEKTVNWLKDEMTHEEGAFFSALDADSEGEEGKYYVWSKQELAPLTDSGVLDLYRISAAGNWEHGNNVLHLEELPPEELWAKAKDFHDRLSQQVSQRIRPGLDNKLLCNWNALAISGLCSWYSVSGSTQALQMALKAGEFMLDNLSQEVGEESGESGMALWHMFATDLSKAPYGFLDDYAACIQAFCGLYQVSFEERWLVAAEELVRYVTANFYDREEGLFYFTDIQAEQLIARKKEVYDNVIPSSNSMLANALYDLGVLLSNDSYLDLAASMFARIRKLAVADPAYMAHWAVLGLKLQGNIPEVVIVGDQAREIREAFTGKVSREVYFAGSTGQSALPLIQGRRVAGKTRIYVCMNRACLLPVETLEEALNQLDEL